jgi:hypothetical protein
MFREFGLMLVLVNGLRIFSGPLGYLAGSKGDFYFIGFYSGISEIWVMFPFVLAELAGFLWGLYRIIGWKTRIFWLFTIFATFPIFRGLTLVDAMIVRPQVDYGNPLFVSIFGWVLPVFVINVMFLTAFSTFLVKGKHVIH